MVKEKKSKDEIKAEKELKAKEAEVAKKAKEEEKKKAKAEAEAEKEAKAVGKIVVEKSKHYCGSCLNYINASHIDKKKSYICPLCKQASLKELKCEHDK